MKLTHLIAPLALGLALSACGSDDLTEEESQQAFGAALSVVTLGGAQASISAENGTFTYSCPGGGTVSFGGIDTESNNESESFEWTLTYNACVTGDLTISGSITYSGESSESGGVVMTSLDMEGELEFSGEVEGSCELDVEWSTSSNGNNVSIEYEGNICGYDASIAQTVGI
ncbi:MAG: hypothetical protein AAFQ82_07820 [Myxococcota bacterium]